MSGAPDSSGFEGFPNGNGKGKGRAVDSNGAGSSQDPWPRCAYCNQLLLDLSRSCPCVPGYDYPPCVVTPHDYGLSFQDQDMDLHASGPSDFVTDFSSSGALFSSLDTGESSNTHNSIFESGEIFHSGHAMDDGSVHDSRPWQPDGSHLRGQPQDYQWQDTEMPDDAAPPLSARQQATLNFWRQTCEGEHRHPTEREVQLIADLVDLSVERVVSWFASHPVLPQPDAPGDVDMQNSYQLTSQEPPNPDVISEVREYAAQRAANDRACENAQSRKAVTGRRYRCTVGCDFSTNRLDAWKRHLRNKYPQKFWHCVLCRLPDKKPFICHRGDKVFPHLEKVHTHVPRSQYDTIRDQSEIEQQGLVPDQCPFENERGPCGHIFQTWEEFLQHCLEHLNERSQDGTWQLRAVQRNPDDKDDNGDGSPSTSTSGNNASARSSATGAMVNPTCTYNNKTSSSSTTTAGPSRRRDMTLAGDAKVVPGSLIDVKRRKLVRPPQGAKFLALEYSWNSCEYLQGKFLAESCSVELSSKMLRHDSLPVCFKRAMTLTRDMGHQYLWIDRVCEDTEYEIKRDSIYQQAALIIVLVGLESSSDHIWHFTCDYKNLKTVLNWRRTSIPTLQFSHVQNLGQGAYGIVDEVCVLSTNENYARKICVSRRDGRAMQPKYLQEIEIQRKFDHPNISRFVAAYVQRRSLNILMLPVAECDLREFLANRQQWKSKLPSLSRWFLPLADAVEYMHGLSCRHKDIKPANILISGDNVLLSDFGTSHDFSTSHSGSHGPGFMTPKYCAPEVAQRKRRGRKADLFSLGCVFLEMITVDLGQTIRALNEYLGFKSRSKELDAVYSRHIPGMRSWLKRLDCRKPLAYQRKILQITGHMLDEVPSKRPTAKQVKNALLLGTSHTDIQLKHILSPDVHALLLHSAHSKASRLPKRRSRNKKTGHSTNIINTDAPQTFSLARILLLWLEIISSTSSQLSFVTSASKDFVQYTSLTWAYETYERSHGLPALVGPGDGHSSPFLGHPETAVLINCHIVIVTVMKAGFSDDRNTRQSVSRSSATIVLIQRLRKYSHKTKASNLRSSKARPSIGQLHHGIMHSAQLLASEVTVLGHETARGGQQGQGRERFHGSLGSQRQTCYDGPHPASCGQAGACRKHQHTEWRGPELPTAGQASRPNSDSAMSKTQKISPSVANGLRLAAFFRQVHHTLRLLQIDTTSMYHNETVQRYDKQRICATSDGRHCSSPHPSKEKATPPTLGDGCPEKDETCCEPPSGLKAIDPPTTRLSSTMKLHNAKSKPSDHLIEVGDFGFFPIEVIQRALAQHSRCTCNHGCACHQSPVRKRPDDTLGIYTAAIPEPESSAPMIVETTSDGDQTRSPSRGSSLLQFIQGTLPRVLTFAHFSSSPQDGFAYSVQSHLRESDFSEFDLW